MGGNVKNNDRGHNRQADLEVLSSYMKQSTRNANGDALQDSIQKTFEQSEYTSSYKDIK
jgi:hypothetical protein